MMVKENNVTGPSKNGQHHLLLFGHRFDRALQYTAITCPIKYEEVLDQYVTSAKKASRKVKYSQLQDDEMSIDSNNSTVLIVGVGLILFCFYQSLWCLSLVLVGTVL